MQLFQHVQALITETDCAVVPGFGAFLATYAPAEILRQENKILPPAKKLAFNRQLQTSDGALALLLSRQENIPYQEAVRILEAWGRHCDQLLMSQGCIKFPEIGTVHFNQQEESFRFEKTDSQNFLPSSFLLPALEIYPVEKPASGLRSFEKAKGIRTVYHRKYKFRSRILRHQKALIASTFVIMLSIFSFIGLKQWNVQEAGFGTLLDSLHPHALRNPDKTQTSPHVQTEFIEAEETTIVEKASEPITLLSQESATPREEDGQPGLTMTESPASSPTTGYFVVVGAFAVQENAAKMSRILQNNFPGRSIMSKRNNRNLELVSVYGGDTKSEAETFLQEHASGFPGAWISKYN